MSSSVHSNGYLEGNSPNSSQLSSEGGGGGGGTTDATLISRTQKQHTTQQVRAGQGGSSGKGPWVDRVSSELLSRPRPPAAAHTDTDVTVRDKGRVA